jgi:hypothetical protein
MKIVLAVLVGALGLVALVSGLSGAVLGARDVAEPTFAHDSNFRFLSVFLAGAGLILLWSLTRLAEAGTELRIISAMVFLGGCARLLSLTAAGRPSVAYIGYIAAELILPPVIIALQAAIARTE